MISTPTNQVADSIRAELEATRASLLDEWRDSGPHTLWVHYPLGPRADGTNVGAITQKFFQIVCPVVKLLHWLLQLVQCIWDTVVVAIPGFLSQLESILPGETDENK